MASRTPFDYPRFQAFDDNGKPISGGTVEFYDAGTTDARAIYSDASLSTQLPNPLTLNSRGEPESGGGAAVNLYLDSGPYKVVLKDSKGSTVWTIDNLIPEPSSTGVTVSTYSDLKGLTAGGADSVYVRGRTSEGDGGEGHFRWDSSNLSTEVDNDEVTTGECLSAQGAHQGQVSFGVIAVR